MTIIQDIITKFSTRRTSEFEPKMVLQTIRPIETITGKSEIFELIFKIQPKNEVRITGAQNIAVFKNPGGRPSFQSVGPDTAFISWEGILTGEDAFDNANNLVKVRDSGEDVFVMFGPVYKQGVIKYFNHSIQRFNLITYQLGMFIEQDLDDITYFAKFEPISRKELPDWAQGYADLLETSQGISGNIGGIIRQTATAIFAHNNFLDRQIQAWGGLANIPVAELKTTSRETKRMVSTLTGTKTEIYKDLTYRNYRESIGYLSSPAMAGSWR